MKNYYHTLNYYYSDAEYYFMYSALTKLQEKKQKVAKKLWEDKENAADYVEKFWLPEDDYELKWKVVQESIFDLKASCFPELLFLQEFQLFPFLGGVTFVRDEFEKFRNFMKNVSDNYFFIIPNNTSGNDQETDITLRMKYPVTITWNELMSGGFISTILFEMPHNNYYVFGDSGKWGKYVANDLETPLNLWGVKKDTLDIFEEHFITSNQNDNVKDVILEHFKDFYKIHWAS